MSGLDLNYLATESTKEDRDKVKDENLLNAHRENIETILSALNKELHLLKKSFGLIRDWEYVAVEAAEQHFEKVRRQVEAIGKLRRSVRALGRLNEKSYDLKGHDDA